MSHQEPAVYNLEYFGDAPFWEGVENFSRRTFLMPLSNPAEFLAFGVFGSSNTVLFVARGRVREHLGDFLARMEQAGASAELYARVPLPWSLVKRYASGDPFDLPETEGPQDPPNAGRIAYGGGVALALQGTTLDITTGNPAWPQESDISTRKVFIMPFIMPTSGQEEFLALGVCNPSDPYQNRFVFVARGSVSDQLGNFTTRMRKDEVSVVEPCNWPPLDYLQRYVNTHYSDVFSPSISETIVSTSTQMAAQPS
ncbi:hypothetical protein [Archangium sp.]|uniref:hypothetical protein n=1 Tax=Archangium sp. TaxID=1872627 RepID=UPI002D44C5A8|nr:hypothetical protein [Archangium sp.]HYO54795.1 hypothetical protein [Archangium sp.]